MLWLTVSALAHASDKRPGGHVGVALPIATLGEDTTVIGSDFFNLGITPGVTVHLGDGWAVDLEFIAFNRFMDLPQPTTFVVDPGLVRKFEGFALGGRVATEVGAATNLGLVPIVVVPVTKLRPGVSYFVELDLPLFLRADAQGNLDPSLTILFQTGAAF